jgi:RNA polymerase sigma-70 factor (ECF subfamily)
MTEKPSLAMSSCHDDISAGPQAPRDNLASSAWEQFAGELYGYLVRRVKHRHNAQDLAQEVYMRLMRVKNQEEVQDCRAYMYTIASHVVHEYQFRARDRHLIADSPAVEDRDERPEHFERDPLGDWLISAQQLDRALEQLPPTLRAALVLLKRDGMSYKEIAQALNFSEHTVKKYLCRAIAILRNVDWDA